LSEPIDYDGIAGSWLMRVLITNDDGIDSVGLHTLAGVAVKAGLEVTVAAPHTERSGSSASLVATTSGGTLIVRQHPLEQLPGVPSYDVEATPAYIAWAAVRGAFGDPPHLVLSGINQGPNTGHAVLHSGTVGAALTAAAHQVPAIAVSLTAVHPTHWETAADVAQRVLAWLLEQPDRRPVVLNVNVPDVALADLRGITEAPLASFGAVQADVAEVGEGFVTLTFSEIDASREPDTDAALQLSGWATITPLTGPCPVPGFDLGGLTDVSGG